LDAPEGVMVTDEPAHTLLLGDTVAFNVKEGTTLTVIAAEEEQPAL
jgi:hypothetical protein